MRQDSGPHYEDFEEYGEECPYCKSRQTETHSYDPIMLERIIRTKVPPPAGSG